MVQPSANDLNLDEPPSHFPVPGTDITLVFLPHPALTLQPPQQDIIRLLALANADIETYIRVPGDGPIMGDEYLLPYVIFSVKPFPTLICF